jgi:hypothetical protein
LIALGDSLVRQARFEEAEAAYDHVLEIEPGNVQAHLGAGRIASLLSEPETAARHYSTAYQTAPRDPEAILAFASVVEDRQARRILLANFLAVSAQSPAMAAKINTVRAMLRIEDHIGTRTLSSLQSPYQPYRLALVHGRPAGLLLRARINSSPDLKLILDTGATGIVLNASATCTRDLEFLAPAALSGFGSARSLTARVGLAASFESGDFQIVNLLVEVSDRELTHEADGVIGLDVFKDFLIRLDPRERVLDLTPLQDADRHRCSTCTPFYRMGHLLLVRGTVNRISDAFFILDSGSPQTVISRKIVPPGSATATMSGVQGEFEISRPAAPASIGIGARDFLE